jgi:hypothetical protein
LIERDSLRSESVDIWRFGIGVSEAGKIAPSHVIDKDKNDVRLFGRL